MLFHTFSLEKTEMLTHNSSKIPPILTQILKRNGFCEVWSPTSMTILPKSNRIGKIQGGMAVDCFVIYHFKYIISINNSFSLQLGRSRNTSTLRKPYYT